MKYFLIVLLSFNVWSAKNVIFKDTFIFKIMGEVVSIRDLETENEKFKALVCHYPKSLVLLSFQSFFKSLNSAKFDVLTSKKPPFDSSESTLFTQAMSFFKLKFYIQTQEVILGENLAKALYIRGKRSNCKSSVFTEKREIAADYIDIFKMEAFVRSRFLPELKGEPTTAQLESAKKNVNLFLDSVSKQVEDEVFWK